MKNIDRLTQIMTKNGSKSYMVHTLYGTRNWIVAEKIEEDEWLLSLLDPMGNITYNLGKVNDKQHYQLWIQLTIREVDKKLSQAQQAKELKRTIAKFLKVEKSNYKKLTKIKTNELRSNRSSKTTNRMCKK